MAARIGEGIGGAIGVVCIGAGKRGIPREAESTFEPY